MSAHTMARILICFVIHRHEKAQRFCIFFMIAFRTTTNTMKRNCFCGHIFQHRFSKCFFHFVYSILIFRSSSWRNKEIVVILSKDKDDNKHFDCTSIQCYKFLCGGRCRCDVISWRKWNAGPLRCVRMRRYHTQKPLKSSPGTGFSLKNKSNNCTFGVCCVALAK